MSELVTMLVTMGSMAEDALLRRWVETWRQAGVELERIRRAELRSLDTRQAVRQIFAGMNVPLPPAPLTSGLVEQQAWFALINQRGDRTQSDLNRKSSLPLTESRSI